MHGGPFAPYRQSERKAIYKEYADQLIKNGQAYYAFDTAADLEAKRAEIANFQYSKAHRMEMKNSIALPAAEVEKLLQSGTPYVVRINIPDQAEVKFEDMIRGEVSFDASTVDDKVLLKADGMPTYHLAVVVDLSLIHI